LPLPPVEPESVPVEKKPEPAAVVPPVAIAKPEPKIEAKPSAPLPEASVAPAKEKSTRFIVQVAAVDARVKATELQARLKKAGIKSYSEKVATKAGERIRIRVGPFASKAEAEKMRARLVKLGLSGSLQPA
jgi:DedD protein